MKTWKISPQDAAISQYIDCYWFLEKTNVDAGPDFPKLNPDPAAHIILANKHQLYHYQQGNYLGEGSGSHLILPYGKTYTLDHTQAFRVLGIKLKVGALYALPLIASASALNKIVTLDVQQQLQISAMDETALLNQHEEKLESAEDCRDQLDALLQPVINKSKDDKHSELVRKILTVFDSNSLIDLSLAEIGSKLGYSQRTIERSFSKVTGFTLKQFHSMQKLEAILHHLHTLPKQDISWVNVALNYGFSDQPHLIRYLKSTLGTTPGQYAEARDLAIDAYGNFDQSIN